MKMLQLLFLICLFVISAGCVVDDIGLGPEETREVLETHPIAPETVLTVKNFNGPVTVDTWEGDGVQVHAVISTRHGAEELDTVAIDVVSNDEFLIESKRLTVNPRVSISYEIDVPPGTIVDRIETSNGAIRLSGTRGDTVLTTSNERVTLGAVDGFVTITTSNGNIELVHPTNIKELSTSNGNIRATIDRIGDSFAEIRTSNGQCDIRFSRDLSRDLTVQTSNGIVTLTFPSEFNANFTAETSNGEIIVEGVELVVEESSKTRLKGLVGNGGPELRITTSNANIILRTGA